MVMKEIQSHEEQLNLLVKYFENHDWNCATEYTIENRRIDFIAWYKYDDIIFVGEVKTDLWVEITNAVGQLQTAKAILRYHYPNHEIHLGVAAPYPEYEKTGTIATICGKLNIWLIQNINGKLIFRFAREDSMPFDCYMIHKLNNIIKETLPNKIEKQLKEINETLKNKYLSEITK